MGIGSTCQSSSRKKKRSFQEIGADFLAETDTNQIFPILENSQIEKLSEQFDFMFGKKLIQKSAIRIITSWATYGAVVDNFVMKF